MTTALASRRLIVLAAIVALCGIVSGTASAARPAAPRAAAQLGAASVTPRSIRPTEGGINLIITNNWYFYGRTYCAPTFVLNNRYESFCRELWRNDRFDTKEQHVSLYWDGYTRCWRQYALYIHYGLPNDGGPWNGPYALQQICYA